MITAAAFAGILAAWIRGGRWSSLARQRLQAPVLLLVSWLCEVLAARGMAAWVAFALARLAGLPAAVTAEEAAFRLAAGDTSLGPAGWLAGPGGSAAVLFLLAVIQYLAVLLFIGLNIRKRGMGLFLVGSIMNGAAILANGGRMPVGPLAARFGEAALQRIEAAPHYLLARGGEPLVFLGDWLPFWSFGWYMVSIGDFLIAAGVFLLADGLMRPQTLSPRRPPKVEYGAEYVYTKERSLHNEERGMVIYGLYRHDFRQGEKRQKDDCPAGIQRSAHDRGSFPHHGAGDRKHHPRRPQGRD